MADDEKEELVSDTTEPVAEEQTPEEVSDTSTPDTEETPVVEPRPISRRGRSILFLVAGILLVIGALLTIRMIRTGVVHRSKPEPTNPAPDTGIRA